MKKLISLLLCLSLIMIAINVYAAESKIDILGDTTVKMGETKSVIAKVTTTGDAIGVISGEIAYSENISKIEVLGKNGWQITYNDATGKFNALKAEGTKNEEFIEIKYTVKSEQVNNATIKLNSVKLSTIEYKSETLNAIEKSINIEQESKDVKKLSELIINTKPTKTKYTEGEKVDNEGLVLVAKYNDGTSAEITNYKYTPSRELKLTDKKVEITYTENSITKTVSYEISVEKKKSELPKEEQKEESKEEINKPDKKDATTVSDNNKLPQTGIVNYIIIVSVVLAIIGIVCYIKYKKYKAI